MIFIDCRNGVTGNMFIAALISLGADGKKVKDVMESSQPTETKVIISDIRRNGIKSKSIDIKTKPKKTYSYFEIVDAIKNAGIDKKDFALSILSTIGKAESKFHKQPLEEVHFHEMASDLTAHIVGVTEACSQLNIFSEKVVSSPVAVGSGKITFSHGTFEIPAPATREIIKEYGISIMYGPVEGELATPTGMAMLANLAKEFSLGSDYKDAKKIGYGAGLEKKGIPNVLKLVLT